MREWPSPTIVSTMMVEGRRQRQPHDVDARDHHLVDAALAQLQHRADHLLLLRLDDALLPAALHEDHQLVGRDPVAIDVLDPEQPRDHGGEPGEQPHDGREDAAQDLDRAARTAIAYRSAWASASVLGTSSPKTIVTRLTSRVTSSSAMTPAEPPEQRLERALEARRDARARERGGEEADERDAQLDDREEAAAGPVDQPLTRLAPGCPRRRAAGARLRRTVTSAISAATNRPLRITRTPMMTISRGLLTTAIRRSVRRRDRGRPVRPARAPPAAGRGTVARRHAHDRAARRRRHGSPRSPRP